MTRTTARSACCALALSLPFAAHASDWAFDPSASQASFDIGNMMVRTVHGTLGTVTGRLHLDEGDVTLSTVTASIDLSKIDTRDAKRDEHLKAKDFFEVSKFPTATFTSTRVEKAEGGKLRVTGALVVHGVTKSVVLDVTLAIPPSGAKDLTARATTRLDRHDLGLSYGPGIMISSEASLEFAIKATAVDVAPPAPAPVP